MTDQPAPRQLARCPAISRRPQKTRLTICETPQYNARTRTRHVATSCRSDNPGFSDRRIRRGGPPVAENTQIRQLYRDALRGKLNRREVFQRGIALGLSANVIGMLALNAVKIPSAFAAEEGKPVGTFQPGCSTSIRESRPLGESRGVEVQEAPTDQLRVRPIHRRSQREEQHMGLLWWRHAVPGNDRARE